MWDGGDECQECHREALIQKIPPLKIPSCCQTLPCSKHGHPAFLPPELNAWLDFFNAVVLYNHTENTLDHVLISKICNAYGIEFLVAFEMLSIINDEVVHAYRGVKKST